MDILNLAYSDSSTKRILRILKRVKKLQEHYNALKGEVQIICNPHSEFYIYESPLDKPINVEVSLYSEPYQYLEQFKKHSGEIILNSENYFHELIASFAKPVQQKLENIDQKIKRLLKLISALKTKISQLKKLNKRKIFREQVNFIYKNMDDTHINFGLLKSICGVVYIQNFKIHSYENYNKSINKIP